MLLLICDSMKNGEQCCFSVTPSLCTLELHVIGDFISHSALPECAPCLNHGYQPFPVLHSQIFPLCFSRCVQIQNDSIVNVHEEHSDLLLSVLSEHLWVSSSDLKKKRQKNSAVNISKRLWHPDEMQKYLKFSANSLVWVQQQ